MYAQVDVIVDGALERSEVFHDYLLLGEFIREEEEDAQSHGYPTEVYIVEHHHDLTEEECECVQYLTDHHPAHSWNAE